MDNRHFDNVARALATAASRRQILKGLAGGTAAGTFSLMGVARAHAQQAEKVVVCHLTESATNPVVQIEVSVASVPAHEAHGDAINPDFTTDPTNCGGCGIVCGGGEVCRDGQCVAACTDFILSGGPSPTETIGVDDDLTVYLNGTAIFVNNDGFASELPPIHFAGQNGDLLRVVATDVDPFCRGIDPLYLHCATTGAIQVLDADGQNDGCEFPITRPANFVFYDQTFTIAVP
ncbi:MAG: hypothetical protein ACRDJH_01000 [Thermomicrobiales bacterium]